MTDDDESDAPGRPLAHPPKVPDPGYYEGPARAAPYALSRMAPSFSLVDVAAEIEKADAMLATTTGGKLGLIDMSFTRVDVVEDEPREDLEIVRRLLKRS